jgi:hypothetical protein
MRFASTLTPALGAALAAAPPLPRTFEGKSEGKPEGENEGVAQSETHPSSATPPSGAFGTFSVPDHPLLTTETRADGREPQIPKGRGRGGGGRKDQFSQNPTSRRGHFQ